MQGTINNQGDCKLSWNMMNDRLYSPDGLQHCLPCERCGRPQWVSPRTVSAVCTYCIKEDDYGKTRTRPRS